MNVREDDILWDIGVGVPTLALFFSSLTKKPVVGIDTGEMVIIGYNGYANGVVPVNLKVSPNALVAKYPPGARNAIELHEDDLHRLVNQKYNDKLVNFALLKIKEELEEEKQQQILIMETHLFPTLIKNLTPTDKISIMDKRLLFFPIFLNAHWSLVVVGLAVRNI